MSEPKRILVCDDSPTYTAGLRRMLNHGPDLRVVETRGDAESAIEALAEVRPDLVTMDVELPGIQGLEAVERIMSTYPVPILVLSSQVDRGKYTRSAFRAAGALDAVRKDEVDLMAVDSDSATAFRRRARILASSRVIRHPRATLRAATAARRPTEPLEAIGICASAGGPQALAHVLAALPADFSVPVFVVQHMAEGFTDGFARWLDDNVALPVALAREGSRPSRGVWVAPEGSHLVLDGQRVVLADRPRDSVYRPSGDRLLESLATLGAGAAGVVLTGMGSDGAAGIAALHEAGAATIAQDEVTSSVFGMPKRAAERGAQRVLPLDGIAPALARLAV